MAERLWVSNYSLDDVTGGAEVLGEQFCKSLKLKYLSASKFGIDIMRNKFLVSRELDVKASEIESDVVLYNSTNFWSCRPNAKLSIAVCCEHFGFESGVIPEERNFVSMKKEEWFYQTKALENADGIIVLSENERRLFKESGFETTIIEPHVDTSMFFPTNAKREKIALFVGRRHLRKGYDIFSELKKLFPRYEFIEIVNGTKTSDELRELYNRSSFLLAPSRYESFGFTFVEALACNLPIIASRTGLLACWQPEEYGIYPEINTVKSFEKAIIEYETRDFEPSFEYTRKRFSFERFRSESNDYINNWR